MGYLGGILTGLNTMKHAAGTIHRMQTIPSAYCMLDMGCDESTGQSDRAQHYETCNWHNAWNAKHSACCRLDIGYEESRRQLDRAGYHESRNWQDVWHAFTSWMARAWACLGAYFLCGPIKAHLGKEAVGPLPPAAFRLAQLACVSDQKACARMCLDVCCQSSRSMTSHASCPMLYALLQKDATSSGINHTPGCFARILCVCIYVCALHLYSCVHASCLCAYVCMHPICMHPMYMYFMCIHVCLFHVYASCVCAHRCPCPCYSDCCTSQL